jgi:hypothetical protein
VRASRGLLDDRHAASGDGANDLGVVVGRVERSPVGHAKRAHRSYPPRLRRAPSEATHERAR